MVSRSELVDILMRRNIPEPKAWEIVMRILPYRLEQISKATIWREADELLAAYVKRTRHVAYTRQR